MLQHQDQPQNPAYGGQRGSRNSSSPSSSLRNRKSDKDGNFNFLPGKDDNGLTGSGDENRNQVRPRNLGPLGRDPPSSLPSTGYHHNSGILSPRSRLPCWKTLEPLPEVETGDDGYGRVPPDGAEEGRMVEEVRRGTIGPSEEKQREKKERQRMKSSRVKEEELMGLEDDDEWGDSESDSEFSHRSGGSMSSLNMDSGGEAMLMGGWDRIGVGEPRSNHMDAEPTSNGNRDVSQRSFSKSMMGRNLGNVLEEGAGYRDDDDDQSSDSDGDQPELMDAVWTLRDREHFKAQEMEKHQAQLTMYRRLALIRWVRTLQGRILEQQNRLQTSFDIILTQRKELLRMGAATAAMANAAPAAAVSQS